MTAGAHQAVLIISASSSPRGRCWKLRTAAVFALIALSGCSTPAPPVNSWCEVHQRKDFSDRGIFGLNPHNKRAFIVDEDSYVRDCLLDLKRTGGPR